MLESLFWNNVAARYGGAGDPDQSVTSPVDSSLRTHRTTASGTALGVAVDGKQGLRPQLGAHGSVGFGFGALFYDTTLGRPVWSNGSVWTDALGAPV